MARLKAYTYPDRESAEARFLDIVDELVDANRLISAPKQAARTIKLTEAKAGGGLWVEAEAKQLGVPVEQVCKAIMEASKKSEAKQAKLEAIRVAVRSKVRQCNSPSDMQKVIDQLRGEL